MRLCKIIAVVITIVMIHRGGKKNEDGTDGKNNENGDGSAMELDEEENELDDEKYHEEFRKAFQKQVYSLRNHDNHVERGGGEEKEGRVHQSSD